MKGLIEGCLITYFHHVNIIFGAKTVDVTLLHLCVTDHKTLSLFRKKVNFKLSKVSNDETLPLEVCHSNYRVVCNFLVPPVTG